MKRNICNKLILADANLCLIVLVALSVYIPSYAAGYSETDPYRKLPTLAETMLHVRETHRAMLDRDAAVAQDVSFAEAWMAGPFTENDADSRRFTPGVLDLAARLSNGQPFWKEENKSTRNLSKRTAAAPGKKMLAFYTVKVQSSRGLEKQISVYGCDKMEVWCNGDLIFEGEWANPIKDYWWPDEKKFFLQNHSDKYRKNIVLPLRQGENLLQVRVQDAHPEQFDPANWVRSDPSMLPAVWHRLREDFPNACESFLDRVSDSWKDQWFTKENSQRLEKEFSQELRRETELDTVPANLAELVHFADVALLLQKKQQLLGAIHELKSTCGTAYPGDELREKLAALTASDDWRSTFERLQRDALVTRNPMLSKREILFAKHYTYAPFHYYDEYNNSLGRRFGNSTLSVLSLKDGSVRDLLPNMRDGLFDRFDLSCDAQSIVFGYQNPEPGGIRLYEVNVDGSGLRQLTFAPEDEESRMKRYNIQSPGNLAKNFTGYSTGYGHWTDDMHPCYLPDGRIAFVSTRVEQSVLCGGHTLTIHNLHRINADGSEMTRLSYNPLHEFAPSVLNDSRLIYNRWEYLDKGVGAVQPLWGMRPDGSAQEEIYGNNITDPGVFIDGRSVPGRHDRIVCTGATHEKLAVGPILLIDRSKDKRDDEAMISLTPKIKVKDMHDRLFLRNGQWEKDIYGQAWCHPFPLSGSFFLVSGNNGGFLYEKTAFGLYLMDRFGNRVKLYDDPAVSCWQPVLLEPRKAPSVVLPDIPECPPETPATLFLTDVNIGLKKYGIKRGEVKWLRVWEYIPRPWSAYNPWGGDKVWGQMAVISKHTRVWVQVLLGIVPVNEDGSASFEVPPNRTLFFQALDKNFQEVHRMRTMMDFKPGESRSCIGCHEYQTAPPMGKTPIAMTRKPSQLSAQPGEHAPRAIHYPTDVQPVLDRNCVSCHSGKKPKGKINLSGELTVHFNRSYETLIDGNWVSYLQEFLGPQKGGGAMSYAGVIKPKSIGSHASRLIKHLDAGHNKVQLSAGDRLKLVTWIDSNAPYYGSYFGRRNIQWRKHPDFRPVPTVDSARGIEQGLKK